MVKGSKTNQRRDKVQLSSHPHILDSNLCLHEGCREALNLSVPKEYEPLFQIKTHHHWQVLTDTKIRKFLSQINVRLGLSSNLFTLHAFHISGLTICIFLYDKLNSMVPGCQTVF